MLTRLLDAAVELYKFAPREANSVLPDLTESYLSDPGVPQLNKIGLLMRLVNAALDLYQINPNADVVLPDLTSSLTFLDSPGVPQISIADLSIRMLNAVIGLYQVALLAAGQLFPHFINFYRNDLEIP